MASSLSSKAFGTFVLGRAGGGLEADVCSQVLGVCLLVPKWVGGAEGGVDPLVLGEPLQA